MSIILNIETSTNVCSVSLSENEVVLATKESFEDKSHSKILSVFINEILTQQKIKAKNIDAIAVSKGPGSYTGLRIGVSMAKGIAFGIEKPLIAVSTLQIMAMQVKKEFPELVQDNNTWFCPMLDARRMEVYTSFFNHKIEQTKSISADIIDENSYIDILEQKKVYFFGNGSEKCKSIIKHKNANFLQNIFPLSKYMTELSYKAFKINNFKDVAYFEPFYLKDFIAIKPKNKVF